MAERSEQRSPGVASSRRRSRELRARSLTIFTWIALVAAGLGTALALTSGPIPVDSTASAWSGSPTDRLLVLGVILAGFLPAFRPLALSARWLRIGDYKFALLALAVVGLLVAGVLVHV